MRTSRHRFGPDGSVLIGNEAGVLWELAKSRNLLLMGSGSEPLTTEKWAEPWMVRYPEWQGRSCRARVDA